MAKSILDGPGKKKKVIGKADLVTFRENNPEKNLSDAYSWGKPGGAVKREKPAGAVKYKYTGTGALPGAKKLKKAPVKSVVVRRKK